MSATHLPDIMLVADLNDDDRSDLTAVVLLRGPLPISVSRASAVAKCDGIYEISTSVKSAHARGTAHGQRVAHSLS
jgi:hypothetical protein